MKSYLPELRVCANILLAQRDYSILLLATVFLRFVGSKQIGLILLAADLTIPRPRKHVAPLSNSYCADLRILSQEKLRIYIIFLLIPAIGQRQ